MASLRFALRAAAAALLLGQETPSSYGLLLVNINEPLHHTLCAEGAIGRRSHELAPGDCQGRNSYDTPSSHSGEDALAKPRASSGKSYLDKDFGGQAAEPALNGQGGSERSSPVEAAADGQASFIKNDFDDEDEGDRDQVIMTYGVEEEEPSEESPQVGALKRTSHRVAKARKRFDKVRKGANYAHTSGYPK